MVIIPKPPNCMEINITNCPHIEKSCPVFLTIKPVTQTAEVSVNRESTKFKPLLCEKGNNNKRVPLKIVIIKIITIKRGGEILLFAI